MALTKHQKLARGMKSLSLSLEQFSQKVALHIDSLQFYFYETHLIIGRPLVTERTLKTMMYTHRIALCLFAQDKELQEASKSKPLIGCIINLKLFPFSRVLRNLAETLSDVPWFIPWGVKINLPSKALKDLEDATLEASLYSASWGEMTEWLDWFEKEDKAGSLTNLFLSLIADEERLYPLRENLKKPALPVFTAFGKLVDYEKKFKAACKADFAPKNTTSLEEAYRLVVQSLRERKKCYLDEFKRDWKAHLEDYIFKGLKWSIAEKQAIFNELTPLKALKPRFSKPRWETGRALDRQTYASFIQYFTLLFLENPTDSKNHCMGEASLLLRIKIHIAQDPEQKVSIKKLLALTTANLQGRMLLIDDMEIELSLGLVDLLNEYTGDKSLERQQKLFPNLTEDLLEDLFHKAAQKLLPPGSIAALPEAFLIFPHPFKRMRILAKLRKNQQAHPQKIYHNPISRQELKRQLNDNYRPRRS